MKFESVCVVGRSPLCLSIRSSSFLFDRCCHSFYIQVHICHLAQGPGLRALLQRLSHPCFTSHCVDTVCTWTQSSARAVLSVAQPHDHVESTSGIDQSDNHSQVFFFVFFFVWCVCVCLCVCVDRCTDLTPLHSCTFASFSQRCHAHLTTFPTHSRWLKRATKPTCI